MKINTTFNRKSNRRAISTTIYGQRQTPTTQRFLMWKYPFRTSSRCAVRTAVPRTLFGLAVSPVNQTETQRNQVLCQFPNSPTFHRYPNNPKTALYIDSRTQHLYRGASRVPSAYSAIYHDGRCSSAVHQLIAATSNNRRPRRSAEIVQRRTEEIQERHAGTAC